MKTDPDPADVYAAGQDPFSTFEQAEPIPLARAEGDGKPEEWPDPQPLAEALLPVARLEPEMVPEPFRGWVTDVAHRVQAPLDFVAGPVVVAAGSVISRAVGIRPKARDDWMVVPNLWGGVVADPGLLKSPCLKAATLPLNRLAAEADTEYKRDLEDVAHRNIVGEAEIKDLKRRLEKAVANAGGKGPGKLRLITDDETEGAAGEDPAELAAQVTALQKAASAPVLRRYVVNDPSVEKLGELLNQNPRGLLLFRDELTGFLYKLEADGHEADKSFYLESWDGDSPPYTYDRIGRGTIRIEAPCISILGGVQPGPLAAYVRSTWRTSGEDGLIQRFQLLVWPDSPKSYKHVDEWPDREAKNRTYEIFKRAADPGVAASVGASPDPNEPDGIPFLRFTPEAQPLFDAWYETLQLKARSGAEHPAIRSHLSKYSSLMPSLALIFHVVAVLDGGARPGAVGADAAKLAILWVNYLESHARRVFAAIARRRQAAGALLGAKITAGSLSGVKYADGFTARDVYLKGWAGLADPEDVKLALEELVDAAWLRAKYAKGDPVHGGRPTVRYLINSRVLGA